MTRFARLTLWLVAAPLLGLGAYLLLDPDGMTRMGLPVAGLRWRIDVRAVYGGLELGAGLFLALCARRPAWARPGLRAALLLYGPTGAGHLLGNLVDGVDPGMLVAALFELGCALLSWLADRHERRITDSPRVPIRGDR